MCLIISYIYKSYALKRGANACVLLSKFVKLQFCNTLPYLPTAVVRILRLRRCLRPLPPVVTGGYQSHEPPAPYATRKIEIYAPQIGAL